MWIKMGCGSSTSSTPPAKTKTKIRSDMVLQLAIRYLESIKTVGTKYGYFQFYADHFDLFERIKIKSIIEEKYPGVSVINYGDTILVTGLRDNPELAAEMKRHK